MHPSKLPEILPRLHCKTTKTASLSTNERQFTLNCRLFLKGLHTLTGLPISSFVHKPPCVINQLLSYKIHYSHNVQISVSFNLPAAPPKVFTRKSSSVLGYASNLFNVLTKSLVCIVLRRFVREILADFRSFIHQCEQV